MKRFVLILISLCLLSPLFPKDLAVLSELNMPDWIDIMGDELYIQEGVKTYVYSMKDFRLIRQFGRRGEGPGELIPHPELAIQVEFHGKNLVMHSTNKLVSLTAQGKLIKEKQLPFITSQIIPFGENYVYVKWTTLDERSNAMIVTACDSNFEDIKPLYIGKRPTSKRAKVGIKIPEMVYIRSTDDNLFIVDQTKGFRIEVFDLQTRQLNPIQLDFPKIKCGESKKKEIIEWYRETKRNRFYGVPLKELEKSFHFPEFLPTIKTFHVKNNILYIQTYTTREDLSEFIIIDFTGKVLKKIFLPGGNIQKIQVGPNTTYTFHGKKYYYLVESSEAGEWTLCMESIDY